MFSADEKTIAELRDLRECLAAVDHAEATALGRGSSWFRGWPETHPGNASERGGDGTFNPPGPGHGATLLGRGRGESLRLPSRASGRNIPDHSTLMCLSTSHGVTCLR